MKKKTDCRLCNWWKKPDRPHELFSFMFNLYVFDVDKGYEICNDGREPVAAPVAKLAPLVDYPFTGDLLSVNVTEAHLDHVDIAKPVLIAFRPATLSPEEYKTPRIFIDGHHRVARAIRDKLETIPAFLLTEEETARIVHDNNPRPYKVASKKRRTRK